MTANPPTPTADATTDLTFERHIAAPPASVAAAITSPVGLTTWLCDEVRIEKREGGRLAFYWHDGYQAFGRWTTYAPPATLAWRWRSDEDDWSTVTFELSEHKAGADGEDGVGTDLSVSHAGVPAKDVANWAKAWGISLDALDVYVRTGKNDRLLRRPMLGVSPNFNRSEPEDTAPGVPMGTPTADGGAGKAGMLAGDRLMSLAGVPLNAFSEIGPALDGHRAGEDVPVVVLRDGKELTLQVTLGSRPQPELAQTAEAVLDQMTARTRAWFEFLDGSLDGLSEAQAEHPFAEGEWSVKQVLGHIILGERFSHEWLTRLHGDDLPLDWPTTYKPAEAHFAGQPLAHLVTLLRSDMEASIAMTRTMLAEDPRPPVFHQLAESAYWSASHLDDHREQIQKTAEAARAVVK